MRVESGSSSFEMSLKGKDNFFVFNKMEGFEHVKRSKERIQLVGNRDYQWTKV